MVNSMTASNSDIISVSTPVLQHIMCINMAKEVGDFYHHVHNFMWG
jgi:hypothetical protein